MARSLSAAALLLRFARLRVCLMIESKDQAPRQLGQMAFVHMPGLLSATPCSVDPLYWCIRLESRCPSALTVGDS
jgi:hypothetical protein